ncbi:hypothetical protein PPL_07307 [Heterostelium album PN500]|uniref:Uncharacterized protein n=1 Tax=Heterostelium pallidum (strain ATCC 26659 / Pp 5 / PN500) TaxID=670386 RepID=D3BEZ1_HETP5|nr:hypothetical protein PPL_07307 [Heterostelium album PN500]EFA80472.1 hypothetical protein PPL_07307 [Heterostelium album PN500]|eukprot:XP_020432592.1 hypothetical protein PPL_07307 [Heterostelium album PN500]
MSKDVKVVVLGLSSVGKSCLVHRFISNQFEHTVMTVGGAYSAKKVSVGNNTEVLLGIWDTAGTAEKFNAVAIFETSSKTGEGVQELLQSIADNFYRKYPNEVNGDQSGVNMSNNQKKSTCC